MADAQKYISNTAANVKRASVGIAQDDSAASIREKIALCSETIAVKADLAAWLREEVGEVLASDMGINPR
ncbi:hypothetical protein [Aliiruegeria haliotis]|uniref:hypothetical protein n=1 Tax=Aliiruegeria haliotis TaxID=1280846 RepID=UPI001FE248A5|nr:hypothetical protein [Aliiruegeria haliotis]